MSGPAFDCAAAQEAIQASLDAELMEAGERQLLDAHLEECAACRDRLAELQAIQRALRGLPSSKLPQAALEEVWEQTTRAPASPQKSWGPGWRNVAAVAAAVMIVAVVGIVQWDGNAPGGPTDAELRRAAEEARVVLGLTSRAIRKTEQAAFRNVLAGEVSGSLRRVPIDWPDPETNP